MSIQLGSLAESHTTFKIVRRRLCVSSHSAMTFERSGLLCADPLLCGTMEERAGHSKDWNVRSWLVLFLLICLFSSKYPQNNDEKEKKLNQWERKQTKIKSVCFVWSFRAIIVSSMTTSNRVANTSRVLRIDSTDLTICTTIQLAVG